MNYTAGGRCCSQVELSKLRFFALPKLALDAVGGESSLRLAEALADVSGAEKQVQTAANCTNASLPTLWTLVQAATIMLIVVARTRTE